MRNRRWSKQRGNDGNIRALVPTEFLDGRRRDPPEIRPEVRSEIPPEITAKIGRLEAKAEANLVALRDEVTDSRVREGAAVARADELRAVVDRLTAWPGAGVWTRLRDLVSRGRPRT